jgi:hypothetical protein
MAAARNVIIFKKVGNSVSPDPRRRLCKRTDGGPPGQDGCRAQCNKIKIVGNRVSLDPRWRLCKKKQMAGPLSKMATVRNVIILKKVGNSYG